ncbi:MAG: carboxypeptidase-like regulatory domain-containing protein, partial [Thermoanaerobaculia bacterium]|nr:carboxypeptidase-like regulatory domain-containing protein [Thermoanaerobaculia bacterium]
MSSLRPVSLTPNSATVFGTVVDPDNGNQPVPGVLVTEVTGLHTATTDGSGNYTITGVAPGFTQLAFAKSGYRPTATGEIDVSPGQAREAHAGMVAASESDQPGKAEGYVRDSAGNPVSGATVSAAGVSGATATTGADGKYSLTIPAGFAFVLQAEKAGLSRVFSRQLQGSAG